MFVSINNRLLLFKFFVTKKLLVLFGVIPIDAISLKPKAVPRKHISINGAPPHKTKDC